MEEGGGGQKSGEGGGQYMYIPWMDAKIKVKIYIFESLFKMDAECIKPFHQGGGGVGKNQY